MVFPILGKGKGSVHASSLCGSAIGSWRGIISKVIPVEITFSKEPGHVEPCWRSQRCQFVVVSFNIRSSVIKERSISINQRGRLRIEMLGKATLVFGHVVART